MNVLDMLQAYLQQSQMSGGLSPAEQQMLQGINPGRSNRVMPLPYEEGEGVEYNLLPSYLPDAVRRSIMNQPSYGEGQRMPQAPNPAFDRESAARFGPQRDADLAMALDKAAAPGREMSDSNAWLRNYYDYSNNGYPGALNSMMGRYPLALY